MLAEFILVSSIRATWWPASRHELDVPTDGGSKRQRGCGSASNAPLAGASAEWIGASAEPSDVDAALQLRILEVLTHEPDLDDVEIAERLGNVVAFDVSCALRRLAERGLVSPVA